MVFIVVHNLVGIDIVVLIISEFFKLIVCEFGLKRLFTSPKIWILAQNMDFGGFDPIKMGSSVNVTPKRYILARKDVRPVACRSSKSVHRLGLGASRK